MNKPSIMNDRVPPLAALERELLAKFEELLNAVPWIGGAKPLDRSYLRDSGPDAMLNLTSQAGVAVQVHVYLKVNLRPSQFPAMSQAHHPTQSDDGVTRVLGVLRISERLSELCRKSGWGWFDLAGNCWIDVPGLLHVERTGMKSDYRRPRERASLASTAAARLMRALLSPDHSTRTWRQRMLQEQTCWAPTGDRPVSLGLVNKVVQYLVEQDFVTSSDDGVRLKDPVGLLRAWSGAYRFDRHQRLSYFTLLKGHRLAEALGAVGNESGNMAAYAAFSAAERQAPHVTQPKTWAYVDSRYLDLLVRHTEAKEVDSGENLVVLIPDDIGVFVSFTETEDIYIGEKKLHCTDPVQTYVDLMHCGGRGEEAAQALLEQRLLPAWKAAGIA